MHEINTHKITADQTVIDPVEKGSGNNTVLAISGWNILNEDVCFPVAVLSNSAIQNNMQWMQSFADKAKVRLAPHGKTTMAPELFLQQKEMGCWAMSLATVPQVVAAYRAGVDRIILANQLVGKKHFELIAEILAAEKLEFYCFVDSVENLIALSDFFSEKKIKLNILLEIGVEGGRCGYRNFDQVEKVCQKISTLPWMNLRGIAFYEGVIHGKNAAEKIKKFVNEIKILSEDLADKNYFSDGEVIISGAGSAWYDLVSEGLSSNLPDNMVAVIRPGCYVVHDTGIYEVAQKQVLERNNIACEVRGELINSLEIWAYVQSVPEPGLAIIGMGKRDVAFDAGLPTPYLCFRINRKDQIKKPQAVEASWKLIDIMDQHSMLSFSVDADLKTGDLISFTTSHPCLTLDKWRKIGMMDDDFHIRKTIETCF